MSGLDDRLRRDLERLAEPPEAGRNVLERVQAKKARRRWIRRTQVAGLVVAVVAGTAGGTYGLSRVFRTGGAVEAGRVRPADGKIAFVSDRDGRNQIYVMNSDGTEVARLTNLHRAYHPVWSPDGDEIAFHAYVDEAAEAEQNLEIFAVRADGSDLRQLTNRTAEDTFPAWSPDGSQIAFVSYAEVGPDYQYNQDIYVMNATGARIRRLTATEGDATAPFWSRDGSAVLFLSSKESTRLPRCPYEFLSCPVYLSSKEARWESVFPDRTNAPVPIPYDSPVTTSPVWSPDGSERVLIDRFDVVVANPDGNIIRRLTRSATAGQLQENRWPVWSADGEFVAFSRDEASSGNYDIYVIGADGAGEQRLTNHPAAEITPAWQPISESGPQPSMSPTPPVTPSGPLHTGCPGQSPFPSPVPEPPTCPTPNPAPPPPAAELGEECDGSTIVAEFDGNGSGGPDGKPDRATVARSSCLFEPDSPAMAPYYATEFAMDVKWGGGANGIWPLPACEPPSNVCRISDAKDIDGDSLAELALTVHEDASTSFVELYRLPKGEPGPIRLDVAPPGDPPAFTPGEAARFALGGTVTHQDLLACSTAPDGNAEISAISAEVSEDQMNWIVHETTFTVEDEVFRVTAVDDYETPVNPLGLSPLDRSPCFRLSTTQP